MLYVFVYLLDLSLNLSTEQNFSLNYFTEGNFVLCFVFLLTEQNSIKLSVDKGEIPHSSCFNAVLRNSSVLAYSQPNSTDQHESAMLLHVPCSSESTNDSLVHTSGELIQLKINLTNQMVNSQLNLFPDSSHHIVE